MGANPFSITLSSSSVSSPQNLDYMAAKYLSFAITGSSSGTFSATAEGCLQDVENTSSAALVWFALSSAITATSSMYVFQGAPCAIRLNVSAASSASVVLRGVQGIGW